MSQIRREERAGGVVVLTLDRPPVNALETSFVRDLAAALEAESREAQGLVLTGPRGPPRPCRGPPPTPAWRRSTRSS